MATQIKLRRDTFQNWYDVNPTLADGEPGYDITNKKLKIGDGTTAWNSLPYFDDQETVLTVATDLALGAIKLGEGLAADVNGKVTVSKLYSTNQTQPAQHYRLELDSNGVVHLPDQSVINGATLKTVPGNYAGITAGPVGADEDSWVWVDNDGAHVATKYSTTPFQWDFTNDGKIKLPVGGDIVDYLGNTVLGGGGNANTGNVTFDNSTLSTPKNVDTINQGVIRLAPGSAVTTEHLDAGQFINIYPTGAYDAPHIHIAAGEGQFGKGDLLLGDDNQNIDVNNTGIITVKTYDSARQQQQFWEFGINGTLYGPAMGGVIVDAIVGSSGQDLYLVGGGNSRESRTLQFTDADGTTKNVYTVDTNSYDVSSILFDGGVTLWLAPGVGTNIQSIVQGAGTATVTFYDQVTLAAATDYLVDWWITYSSNVSINSPIRQNDSFTRTTNANAVELATPTVVWSGSDVWVSSAKLMIQVEANELGDATGWHTQTCEAVIASRGNQGDPHMTVYGVTHTSVDPLMTFTVARNASNLIEVTATPTATLGTTAYIKVYSVEMISRD